MQFAKDCFYLALRERLARLNPARTVRVNGVDLVAMLTAENLLATSARQLPNAYYLVWGACRSVPAHEAGAQSLLAMDCVITYDSAGTCDSGVDRGRWLGELDQELLAICNPQSTRKRDFTHSPSVDLGTNVFWTLPDWDLPQSVPDTGLLQAPLLHRVAHLRIFFFAEGSLS